MNIETEFKPLISSSKKESVVLETLDGFEFEKVCGRIFEKLQYGRVEVVQYTGDMGRDLLIHTNAGLMVVECKHQPNSSIGRPVVQKLHSAAISSKAIRGIIVTTGKFSVQSIEHAKSLTPPIELIDRNILTDLATQAGMELIFEGKTHTVLTYPVSSNDKLQDRIDRFINSRFESYPEAASKLVRIKNRGFAMHPSYVIQYDVNATFETSVGVIHRENAEDGTILIDGNEGKLLKQEIAKHIKSASLTVYDESIYKDSNLKKVNFHIDANTLKTLSKNYISNFHTKNITYWGKNNQKYTKLCMPSERDIFISNIKQVYVPFQQIELQVIKIKYDITAIENSENLLCYTKMFNCAVCGGYIKNTKTLCNSCGAVVHNKAILDSHSFECKICGKTLCRKCTYDLGFDKKVCKECAIKSGGEVKPVSMEMNQRTILGILFIIGGGIGVLMNLLLVTSAFIIVGTGIMLLNRKTQAPPYEFI
jgi:restriction system protein